MLTGENNNNDTEKMQSNNNSYHIGKSLIDSSSDDEDSPALKAIRARIDAAKNARKELELKKLEETGRTPRGGFEIRPLPVELNTPSRVSSTKLQQDFQKAYAQLNTPTQELRQRAPVSVMSSLSNGAFSQSEKSETEDHTDKEFMELDEKYKHLVSNTQQSTDTISDLKAKLDAQREAHKRAADAEREAMYYNINTSMSNVNSLDTVSTSMFSTTLNSGNASIPDPKALADRIDRLGKTIQKVRSDIEDEDASLANFKETSELVNESQVLSQRLESIVQTIQSSDLPQQARANVWRNRLNRVIDAVLIILILFVLHNILTAPHVQSQILAAIDDTYTYLKQRRPQITVFGQYANQVEKLLQWLTGQWNEHRPF